MEYLIIFLVVIATLVSEVILALYAWVVMEFNLKRL